MQAIPTTELQWEFSTLKKKRLRFQKRKRTCCCMFFRDDLLLKVKFEAFQMATIKKLPILYLVQDNEWDISAIQVKQGS